MSERYFAQRMMSGRMRFSRAWIHSQVASAGCCAAPKYKPFAWACLYHLPGSDCALSFFVLRFRKNDIEMRKAYV